MLGVAQGQEARLARFLDIPHRFVAAGSGQQAVDAVISLRFGKEEAERYVPRLVHLPGAGADAIEFERLPPDCVVCNVFEHEIPIAEYVLAAILNHAIGYMGMVRSFDSEQFGPLFASRKTHAEVHGKTLGIVGFGHIGKLVTQRAQAFGMRVHAISRSGHAPEADEAGDVSRLPDMLRQADFVLIACPLTPETHGLIGAAQLKLMKSTAVLINVSRGPIVDEEALFTALSEGAIGGATLDVWYQYPSPGNPAPQPSRFAFEKLPHVHCTVHSCAWTEEMFEQRFALIADNLERLRDGRPLLNVIRETVARKQNWPPIDVQHPRT
jgi:phosphoglycerate dehydrogenase-like enzyme